MNDVILKIRERYEEMSRAEKKISDFILSHSTECLGMTTMDLARESEVSSASIIRYVQKLGFEGLEGFKLALASAGTRDKDSDWRVMDLIISPEYSIDGLCQKLEQKLATAMKDFFYQLDKEALLQAIHVLKKSRRIYTLGIGASMMPAYDLFHKLKRADFNSFYSQDTNMVMEFFNYLDERDSVVAFSYSGQSKEIIYACEAAKERGVIVIAVTRKSNSLLAGLADICLFVPNQERAMRIGAFTSRHTSMSMADLLYLGVIQDSLERLEGELMKTRKLVERLKIKEQEGELHDRNRRPDDRKRE